VNPDLLAELADAWIVAFDLLIWGLPLAVTAVGALVGAVAMFLARDPGEVAAGDRDATRIDLLRRREAVVEAVRALDLERDKLDPDDYEARRRALLAHGAGAMRELERAHAAPSLSPDVESAMAQDPTQTLDQLLEAERSRLGDERIDEIRRLLARPAERGGLRIGPRWQGALWALAGVGAVLALYLIVGSSAPSSTPVASTGPVAPGEPGQPPATPEESQATARLAEDPRDLVALNTLTDWSIRRQRWGEAARFSQRALQVSPTDPEARTWAGLLAFRAGDAEVAVSMLDAVIAEHPSFPIALQYRGILAVRLGETEIAVRTLEAAVAATSDPEMRLALRQLLNQARTAASPAAADLTGTIEIAPGVDPSAWGTDASVFVSVRAADGPPMPLRAKKLPPGPFPLAFSVTAADSPMGGGPLPDQVVLVVKVDLDGNPMGDDLGAPKVTVPLSAPPPGGAREPVRVVLGPER
jgi:cytochrome c-type biogenesis protein CcmH